MSIHESPDGLLTGGFSPEGLAGHDDGIAVRFPPGLGIIPPRELTRVPRPRRGSELAG